MVMQSSRSKPFRQRLVHFLRRPLADQWLFLQAYFLLGLARLAILTIKFEPLARKLGALGVETPREVPVEQLIQARRVAWAIQRASGLTFWQSNCFPQAIAAKILLRQRGIASTLYLGAAFKANRSEGLEAHAWLRCGPLLVTGGAGHKRFGVVGMFA
jgi:hypothetical protein